MNILITPEIYDDSRCMSSLLFPARGGIFMPPKACQKYILLICFSVVNLYMQKVRLFPISSYFKFQRHQMRRKSESMSYLLSQLCYFGYRFGWNTAMGTQSERLKCVVVYSAYIRSETMKTLASRSAIWCDTGHSCSSNWWDKVPLCEQCTEVMSTAGWHVCQDRWANGIARPGHVGWACPTRGVFLTMALPEQNRKLVVKTVKTVVYYRDISSTSLT